MVFGDTLTPLDFGSGATTPLPQFVKQGEKLAIPAWASGTYGVNGNPYFLSLVDNNALRGVLTGLPASAYSMLYSTDHAVTGSAVGRVDFETIEGTWTDFASNPIDSEASFQDEAPSLVYDPVNARINVYMHREGGAAIPTYGSQASFTWTTTDLASLSNGASGSDTTWRNFDFGQHTGYGYFERLSASSWRALHRVSGGNHIVKVVSTSSDGITFTRGGFVLQNVQHVTGHGYSPRVTDVFTWGGKTYVLCALMYNRHLGSNADTRVSFGALEWNWTTRRIIGPWYELVAQGASGDDDAWLRAAKWVEIGGQPYIVYSAWNQAGTDGGVFLAKATLGTEQSSLTPIVTIDTNGEPSAWETAGTTLFDWDATAEDVPAASLETVVVTGTDASSFSLGNYYEFDHTAGSEQDIQIRSLSTINPVEQGTVDIILEGMTGEQSVDLSLTAFSVRILSPSATVGSAVVGTDSIGDTTNGVEVVWTNSKEGKILGYAGGVTVQDREEVLFLPWDAPTVSDWIRSVETDWKIRIWDKGKSIAMLVGDRISGYAFIPGITWANSKISIRTQATASTWPACWTRFTRFAVKYGGTASFDPESKLVIDLDAAIDVQNSGSDATDGQAVDKWIAAGGQEFDQGTGAAQPLYRASVAALNNEAAIEFDGTDDFLKYDGRPTEEGIGTLIVVFILDSLTGSQKFIVASGDEDTGASHIGLNLRDNPGAWKLAVNTQSDIVYMGTTITASTAYIAVVRTNGADYSFRLNGAGETATVESGANDGDWFDEPGPDNLTIGNRTRTANQNFVNAKVARVKLYEDWLTDAEVATVESSLATRYGITLP